MFISTTDNWRKAMALNDILVLIILFITNTIQAITGFAGTLLAMPPTIKLIGVDEAKILLTLVAQISCFLIVLTGLKDINIKEFLKMFILMVVGMFAGIKIYEHFPMNLLLIFYGIMIIVIAIFKLKGIDSFKLPEAFYPVVIVAAGIIHGMFASGGALLVIYASHKLAKKEEFRVTMALIWFSLGFYISGVQIQRGYLNAHVIRLLLIGLIPVFLGTYVGNKLVQHINQAIFMKITYILLILSGLMAIF